MTIKKRLFVSNILMIVISILLAGIITLLCVTTMSTILKDDADNDMNYYKEMLPIRTEVVALVSDYLSNPYENYMMVNEINSKLSENNMRLEVTAENKLVVIYGDKTYRYKYDRFLRDQDYLVNEEVYTENIIVNNVNYQLTIHNIRLIDKSQKNTKMQITIGVIIAFALIIAVLLTNKVLTKFVFVKIEEPLNMLSKGVHQIGQGNLSYQIDYKNNDEFAQICTDFNGMAQHLKDSVEQTKLEEESRKELLASISHDLRSPLTSIKAYIEGLIDGVATTPEMQKSYMNTIKTKTDDIDRLVSRLFLFSKLNLGQMPADNQVVNLKDELMSVINSVKYDYMNHGVELSYSLADNTLIKADKSYVHSIISNIFDNSVKYKPDRDILIKVTTEIVGDDVKLTIADSGDGVPEESLSKIFDVFYRIDKSRTNPKKGSGLGLAITAKSVENMGGKIYAENGELGGLSIIMSLPLIKGGQQNEQQNIDN